MLRRMAAHHAKDDKPKRTTNPAGSQAYNLGPIPLVGCARGLAPLFRSNAWRGIWGKCSLAWSVLMTWTG